MKLAPFPSLPERRRAQREFLARGLRSRDGARRTGKYLESDAVIGRLEKMLARAKERG